MYMSLISFYLYYIYILTLLTKALSRKQKSLPSKSYFCWFKLQMDRIHSLSYFYLCPFRPRPPAPCSHGWFKHECCDASEPVPTGSGVSTHISDRSGPWARLHNGCGFKREDLWGNRALQKGRKAKCGHEGETLVFPFPLMEFKKKKNNSVFLNDLPDCWLPPACRDERLVLFFLLCDGLTWFTGPAGSGSSYGFRN